jgi:hypothetical protein
MKKKKQKNKQQVEPDLFKQSLEGLAIFGLVYGIGTEKIFPK